MPSYLQCLVVYHQLQYLLHMAVSFLTLIFHSLETAVSYTHLTLPTILRV